MVRRRSTVRFRNGAPLKDQVRSSLDSSHPTLRMGAVAVLGGIWEIVSSAGWTRAGWKPPGGRLPPGRGRPGPFGRPAHRRHPTPLRHPDRPGAGRPRHPGRRRRPVLHPRRHPRASVAEAQALALTELAARAATSPTGQRRAIVSAADDYSAVSRRYPYQTCTNAAGPRASACRSPLISGVRGYGLPRGSLGQSCFRLSLTRQWMIRARPTVTR